LAKIRPTLSIIGMIDVTTRLTERQSSTNEGAFGIVLFYKSVGFRIMQLMFLF